MGYWDKTLARRINRRRALAVTGGSALTAFLIACGGGDEDETPSTTTGPTGSTGSSTGASTGGTGATGSTGSAATGATTGSGPVTQAVDTTSRAVRGGTLKEVIDAESQTLDPARPQPNLNRLGQYVFSTMLIQSAGYLESAVGTEMAGDFAESWELSPDRTEIVFKLRPGVRWHDKAPVNGREADVDDVLYSWNRYVELSPFAQLSDNSTNPEAPILSVTAPDASTISVKLGFPLAYALNYFANYGSQTGNMIMLPKEADGGYDVRREIIGHGPYMLDRVEPSVGYTLKRHEGYYDPDSLFVDQIDVPIVPEYATRIAQFRAGNIHRLAGAPVLRANGEDLISIKNDDERLNVYETDFQSNANILLFGLLPENESPFLDERVRQAISMSVDRDAWIDAIFSVSIFEDGGMPIDARWNSHLLADWDGYWLDPQGSDFGPNAKYFQFNLEEAKALMEAAGYGDGFTTKSIYPADRYNLTQFAEPMDGMLRELGIDIEVQIIDYATEYNNYRDTSGQFEGWAYSTVTGTTPQRLHPVSAMAAEYWPRGGAAFKGFSTSGMNDKAGDPELTALIEKARVEFDVEAQQALVHDMQRYLAEKMYGMNMPGGASAYDIVWPAVQNHAVWRAFGWAKWYTHQIWLDQSQPPFA